MNMDSFQSKNFSTLGSLTTHIVQEGDFYIIFSINYWATNLCVDNGDRRWLGFLKIIYFLF